MNVVLKLLGGLAALLAILACVIVLFYFYSVIFYADWAIGPWHARTWH